MAENRRRGATPDKNALAALSTPLRLQKAEQRDVVNDLASPQSAEVAPTQPNPRPTTSTPQTSKTGLSKKTSFYQHEEDANRMRAAYLNTQVQTGYSSLSEFIAAAIGEKVSSLEAEYNHGNAWTPLTAGVIPTGKPLRRRQDP